MTISTRFDTTKNKDLMKSRKKRATTKKKKNKKKNPHY